MKDINFINSVSPKKIEAARSWIRTSVILFLIAMSIMVFVNMRQWFTLKLIQEQVGDYQKTVQDLHTTLAEKKRLKSEEKRLKKQYALVNELSLQSKKEFELIEDIYNVFPVQVSLQQISVAKNSLYMSIICPDEQIADFVLQKIAENPSVKGLQLISIEPSGNNFIFTIKGVVV